MTEPGTIRLVVLFLGALTLAALGAATALTITGHAADPAWSLAGTGLGALGAVLVSTRSSADPTVATVVEQAHAAGAAQTEAAVLSLGVADPPPPPVLTPHG